MSTKNKFLTHLIGRTAAAYRRHPRVFWIAFLVFMYVFFIIQSYVAQPRPFFSLVRDLWDLALLFFPLIYVFWSTRIKDLLIIGVILLAISTVMWFGGLSFIKPAYGTLLFICALWFLGDYFNTRKFGTSVYTELTGGNCRMAFGIFISTMVVGAVVEIANIPFRVWWYQWPFPSVEVMGLPVIMMAFGWLPWVLAMFVFLYPFALKKPKKYFLK